MISLENVQMELVAVEPWAADTNNGFEQAVVGRSNAALENELRHGGPPGADCALRTSRRGTA